MGDREAPPVVAPEEQAFWDAAAAGASSALIASIPAGHVHPPEDVAEACAQLADALLLERRRRHPMTVDAPLVPPRGFHGDFAEFPDPVTDQPLLWTWDAASMAPAAKGKVAPPLDPKAPGRWLAVDEEFARAWRATRARDGGAR